MPASIDVALSCKDVEDKIEKSLVTFCAWSSVQGVPKVHYLAIDMTPAHHIDSMGLHMLEDLVFETRRKGIQLLLANSSKQARHGDQGACFERLVVR